MINEYEEVEIKFVVRDWRLIEEYLLQHATPQHILNVIRSSLKEYEE